MAAALTALTGGALLAGTSVAGAAALRVRGVGAFALAVLVAGAADVVLATIVLSLLRELTAGGMLAAQALIAVAVVGGWLAAGRPRPPGRPPWAGRTALAEGARRRPGLAFVLALLALTMAVTGFSAVAVALNNWDSMAYHLSRIAFWLQYHSALPFHNGTFRELGQPPNAEYLQMWTMLMSGSDRLAGLVQWLALGGLAVSSYLGARLLGFARAPALFAGALFAMLPMPVLQASTTQNDLVVSFFLSATAVFGARGLRDRHRGELAVGALAFGLALGAKGTALIALPPLALLAAAGIRVWRPPRAFVLRGAVVVAVSALALGSFNYVLNIDRSGDPLGGLQGNVGRESSLAGNAARVATTFFDAPGLGLGWLDYAGSRAITAVTGDLKAQGFGGVGMDTRVDEDTAAYGLVGFLLFLPLLVVALVRRRSPPPVRLVAAAALLYLALFVATNEYNPWLGRVMMPGLALGAPLLALLYRRPALRTVAGLLTAVSVAPALFVNDHKQLLTPPETPNVLALDRNQQQTLPRPEVYPALIGLRRLAAPSAPIGLVRATNTWAYPFFGRRRMRRVVALERSEATPETMRRLGLAGILFANVEPPPRALRPRRLAPGYWFVPARPLSPTAWSAPLAPAARGRPRP